MAKYKEKEWQHLCTSLARICLAREPLTSRHAVAQTVRGCGEKILQLLSEIDAGSGSNASPARGTYCGAAAALLVALLELTELAEGGAHSKENKDGHVVAKEALIDAAAAICEQPFITSAAYASGAAPHCAAAQQLTSLSSMGFVKERQRSKLCPSGVAFSLTEAGRARATELRSGGEAADAAPLHHHDRVRAGERGALILLVDEREGGGARHHLRELCAALIREGCRFETRRLPQGMGDYAFVRADGSPAPRERFVPRLIERKAAADVAASLKDGRWERQQAAMKATSSSRFGGGARLEYLLEGRIENEMHRPCPACLNVPPGGRGVGGCPKVGWPTIDRVDAAIAKLEADGYTITRTDSLLATAKHLASEAANLQAQAPAAVPPRSPVPSAAVSPAPSPASGRLPGRGSGGAYPSQRAHASTAGGGPAAAFALDSDDDAASSKGAKAGAKAGAATKRPRPKKAPAGEEAPKKPRRANGALKRPVRPDGLSREQPLPLVQSCNYAFLVAMDREIATRQRLGGGGSLDAASVTFSKEELMRLANDRSRGALCSVDLYDGRAGASTQAGAFAYDGWANVHSGLIKRDLPWRPLLVEHRNKKAPGGGALDFSSGRSSWTDWPWAAF